MQMVERDELCALPWRVEAISLASAQQAHISQSQHEFFALKDLVRSPLAEAASSHQSL